MDMTSGKQHTVHDADGEAVAEIGSGNVFADLEFANPDEEAVKARIVRRIQKVIDQRGLTQKQAGDIIGLPQSKVSTLLRGKWDDSDYTVDRLIRHLNKLGVTANHRPL
jgi:predicted XRE-type DNA-binding protein